MGEGEDEDRRVGCPLPRPSDQRPLTRTKSRSRSGKERPASLWGSFPRPSHSRRAPPPSLWSPLWDIIGLNTRDSRSSLPRPLPTVLCPPAPPWQPLWTPHPPTTSLGWLGAGAPTQLLLCLPGSVPCPASLKSLEPLDFNSGPTRGCYLWGPPALTPRIYSVPLPTASQNGLMFLCKLHPLSAPSRFLPSPPLALPPLTTAPWVEGTSPVVQWQTPSSNNTREDSTHGHHKMVNAEIRLIIFFAEEDEKALDNQQKQDLEVTVIQIISSLLQNWRK